MLFAAFTCPFLARPNARRGLAVDVFGESFARGTARGAAEEFGGAVAGFAGYEFRYVPGEQVAFVFTGLVELRPHLLGADQIPEMAEALAAIPESIESGCPSYLLDDESAAEAHARAILDAAMARDQEDGAKGDSDTVM